MAVPKTDKELNPWTRNFDARLQADAEAYHISPEQAATYHALHLAYISASDAASHPGTRSQYLVAAKNSARTALLAQARLLYALLQISDSISDAAKISLGVLVPKSTLTRAPVPQSKPRISILSIVAYTVHLAFADSDRRTRLARPDGVAGLYLFSYVGPTSPATAEEWSFVGSTGRNKMTVTFPASLAPGTKVWFTATYFNTRHQSGEPTTPTFAYLSGGAIDLLVA